MKFGNLLDWSVARKLWLTFGLLIIILALSTTVSSILMHLADEDLSEAVDVHAPLQEAALEMKISAGEMARAVIEYAGDRNPSHIQAADDAEASFEAVAVEFASLASTDQVRELGEDVSGLYEEFNRSRLEIVRLADQRYSALQSFRDDAESLGALVDDKLRAAVDVAASDAAIRVGAATSLGLAVVRTSAAIEVYVGGSEASGEQSLRDAIGDFENAGVKYRSVALSSYEESWLSQIEKDYQSLVDDGNALMALEDNLTSRLDQFREDHSAIEAMLADDIQPLLAAGVDRASQDSKNAMTGAIISLVVLGAIGIALGGVSAAFMSRRITRSLHGLRESAGRIADGKFEHRFFTDTHDEFGEAGFALNRMMDHVGRSREALGESEETAWALLDATTDSVVLADARGVILACNEIAAARFGKSLEQMIDLSCFDLLPADVMASRRAQLAEVIRTRKPIHFEDEYNGVVYDERMFPVIDHRTDKVTRLAIFSRDITTRKWVEDVAERLGRRNELILEAAGEGIYGLDTMGRTTFVNPAAARMLGYRPEDLIGERHHELVHHSRPSGIPYPHEECHIYMAFKDGEVHKNVADEVFWRKDGTSFHVEYTSTPIMEDGKVVGAVVTFRDISERKQVEEALKRTTERYRIMLESPATVILTIDKDGSIADCNARASRVLGYGPDEILGRKFREFIDPDYVEKAREVLKEVLSKGFDYNQRFRMLRKDSTSVDVNMNAAAVRGAGGEFVRTVCIIDEIGERAST